MLASEYVVVLWLIPVTLSIIIPLAVCFAWLAVKFGRDLAVGRIPFIDYSTRPDYVIAEGGQRRKEPRVSVQKQLVAEITDGVTSFSGLVANISRMGMCIMGIPESIPVSAELVSVVIRNGPDELYIVGRPRWQNPHQSNARMMGLEITRSSEDWNEYVESY